jgi:3-hydroxybutyryl-CoA dehydrogenase
MGHAIAQVFATAGWETVLIDRRPEALRAALRRIRANLRTLVRFGALKAEAVGPALARIRTTAHLGDGVAGAAFVQETIPEDLRAKRALFAALGALAGGAVLGSNAATIPIHDLARGMRARDRIVGVHWVNPPYVVPVVEVIPSRWTAPAVTRRAGGLLRAIGKVPVVCRDIPGKIILRVQAAMLNEAIHLVEIGAATPEAIDTAVRLSTGLRLPIFGPLRFSDFHSTHKNTLEGMRFLYRATGDRKFRPPRLLREKVRRGELGIWSGKGFYDYPQGYTRLAGWRDARLIELVARLRQLGVVPG